MSIKRKQCKKCLQKLPSSKFYHHPKTADRLFRVCKTCHCKAGCSRYHEKPEVRERVKDQARRWKQKHPLKAKAQQAACGANSRAAERDIPERLTGDDVIHAWEASGFWCAVCEKDLTKQDGDLTIDHTTPMSCGGTNTEDNLRAACRSCNTKESWKWRRKQGTKRAA